MLLGGTALMACALVWLFLLVLLFGKQLSAFSGDLCRTLDTMISGNKECDIRPPATFLTEAAL